MFQKVLYFIEAHSALVIGFVIFFCIAGVSFAASPSLFGYIFSSEETITSVDNSILLSTNLNELGSSLKINSLKEDQEGYQINYSHDTFGVDDGFWRKVSVSKTISVNKKLLNKQSLGSYVAKKIVDNFNSELTYLKQIQDLEKIKGSTQKIVTTTYSGIIGNLFNPTEKMVEDNSLTIQLTTSTTNTEQEIDEDALAELIIQLLTESQNQTTSATEPSGDTPTLQPGNVNQSSLPLPPVLPPVSNPTSTSSPPIFSDPAQGYLVVPPPNYVPEPDSVNSGPLSE